MELSEAIDNDIVLTLEEVMKSHKETSKRMFNDAQRLANYCRDTKSAHSKLARQYHATCSEAEMLGQEVVSNLAMKPNERSRMGQRAVHLSKQAKVTQKDYLSSIEQANRAQVLFEQQMPLIFAAMQEMEMKRAICLRDCLMKLAVYETSWLRNLQYDIDATVTAAEVSDPGKDLQEFIRKNQADGGPPARAPPLSIRPFWELGKPRNSPVTPQQRAQHTENDQQIKAHCEGLQPMLAGFLAPEGDPQIPADFTQRWEPGVAQLKNNLQDLRARAAFLQVIAKLIVMRQPPQAPEAPPVSLENCLPIRITSACFEVVVTLFLEACSLCEHESDAWSGRTLMVLVQLISCEVDGGRVVNLLTRVYNHPLWNKVAFWEDTMLVGIFEGHSIEAIVRRQNPNQPGAISPWAVSTPFTNKFVWFMSQFGIRGEQARTCIREGLRKNAQILGPAIDQYTRSFIHQVDAQEAQAAAASQAAVATGAPGSQPSSFAPASRQLEERSVAPQSAAAGGPGGDGEDDLAAVALGVQDGFADPTPDPEDFGDAEGRGEDPVAGPVSSTSDSPGNKEPADTLRKLGVDQPSSSDVFG